MTDTESKHGSDVFQVRLDELDYCLSLPSSDEDSIQQIIRKSGAPYEPELVRDVIRRCPAGGLVFDVGANIGNHTVSWAVAGLDVWAFEPLPELRSTMERSVQLNHVEERVRLFDVALSDRDGHGLLVPPDSTNLGTAHLVDDGSTESTRATSVALVPMPDPGRDLAAVKIDVEGSECAVISGGVAVLSKYRPLLYVECLDRASFMEVWRLIQPLGYRYRATFNASPTHLFVWEGAPAEGDDPVLGLMDRFYQDHAAYVTTRDRLLAANQKYREVTATIGTLQGQVASMREKAASDPLSALSAHDALISSMELTQRLERQLLQQQQDGREVRRHAEAAAAESADLRLRLEEARAALASMAADRESLQSVLGQVEADALAKGQVADTAVADADRLQTELDEARVELATVTDEVTRMSAHRQLERQQYEDELSRLRQRSDQAVRLEGEVARLGLVVSEWVERADIERVKARQLPARASADSATSVGGVRVSREDLTYLREWMQERQKAEAAADQETARLQERWESTTAELKKVRAEAEESTKRSVRTAEQRDEQLALHVQEIDRLQQHLSEAHRRLEAEQEQALSLRESLSDSSAQAARLTSEIEEMRAEWDAHRSDLESRALKAEATSQELQGLAARLERELATVSAERASLRATLHEVRGSRTFLSGKALRETRGPRGAITLPWRLWKAVQAAPRSDEPKEIDK